VLEGVEVSLERKICACEMINTAINFSTLAW